MHWAHQMNEIRCNLLVETNHVPSVASVNIYSTMLTNRCELTLVKAFVAFLEADIMLNKYDMNSQSISKKRHCSPPPFELAWHMTGCILFRGGFFLFTKHDIINIPSECKVCKCALPSHHLRSEILFSFTCNIPKHWKSTKTRSCLNSMRILFVCWQDFILVLIIHKVCNRFRTLQTHLQLSLKTFMLAKATTCSV